MKKNILYKYDIEFNNFDYPPIEAEYIYNIYSDFWEERIFIVINPRENIKIFLHNDILIRFHVDYKHISEWVYIKDIKIINGLYFLFYESKDNNYANTFNYAKDLYLTYGENKNTKIWKNFTQKELKYYLYTMMHLEKVDNVFNNQIIINGNIITGCYDFYCELGFLLNNNKWGYIAWNLDSLDDSLKSMRGNISIKWLNYRKSQIIIDEDAKKITRFGLSFMYDNYADGIYEILQQYIQIERYI